MKALGSESLVQAILEDFRTAPIEPRLRTTLEFLEKVTLQPDELSEADAGALEAAGIDQAAAGDALYVAFVFGVMDRLADAFDFRLNHARGLRWVTRILLGVGYRAGCVPG